MELFLKGCATLANDKPRDYKKEIKINIFIGIVFLIVALIDMYNGVKETGSIRATSATLWLLTSGIWFISAFLSYKRFKKGL
jgi:ABC-type thiamin/hydroxymethylpyrimidine transport system permease subunit